VNNCCPVRLEQWGRFDYVRKPGPWMSLHHRRVEDFKFYGGLAPACRERCAPGGAGRRPPRPRLLRAAAGAAGGELRAPPDPAPRRPLTPAGPGAAACFGPERREQRRFGHGLHPVAPSRSRREPVTPHARRDTAVGPQGASVPPVRLTP